MRLDGSGAEGALVGGKGAWLDRLLAEGFEVPATAVVTTEAYRAVAAHPDLATLLDELRGVEPGDDLDDERRRVDEAFLAVPLPSEVRAAIAEAAASVRGDAGALLAVLSSATAEDMAATSFAGQYRSFLEVGDDADVERAVRLVWASLWHPAPRAYRRANGIDEAGLAMAAVVMAMVPALRAGVAFTVDPGGQPDAVRVEDVEGYAEGLVAGAVTPGVHLVARDEGARDEPDPLIGEVTAMALRVERAFGCPQDVEWAWDGERTYLVQARPITAAADDGDGFDTPLDDTRHSTTAGIAEMLPGVLPPLVWTVSSLAVEEGFRSLLDQLGALPVELVGPHGMLGRTRGRAVMDLTHLREVAGALPGGSEDDVEGQYFGRAGAASAAAPEHPSGRGLRSIAHDLRVIRARRLAQREAEVCEVAVERTLDELSTDDPAARGGRSDAALLALHRRVLDLTLRTVAAEMAVAAAAVAAYRRLELLLLRHLDERETATWAQELTTQAGVHAGWSEVRLAEVRALLDDPRVAAVVRSTAAWPDAEAQLGATPQGRVALTGIRAVLWRAGSMAVPGGRAWAEDPQPVWDLVRSDVPAPGPDPGVPDAGVSDRELVFDALADELRALPGWKRHRMLTGGLIDARLTALRRAAADATDLLRHREQTKADVLALGGVLRRLHLEVGRRLVERGSLDATEDVDLLGLGELAAALAGRGPTRATLARRRHRLETYLGAGPLPVRFRGEPRSEPQVLPEGDLLVGWGAGPGVAHGAARVVAAPSDGGFERGDVLVARSTDASWSPLFLRAAAIVVEEGGPLSHAAIVARELGIPAVLNVPGVVARITADTAAAGGPVSVTVDGDQGVLVITTPETVPQTVPQTAEAG